jgi:peptide/nickel transport system substrate-binding protein
MLYDFEWANKNLFGGKYTHTVSFWQNSELSALGHPADDRRRLFWPPTLAVFPPMSWTAPGGRRSPTASGSGPQGAEGRLRSAEERGLHRAGWGHAARSRGRPFGSEILTASQDEERSAAIYQRTLEKLGIDVTIRSLDGDQIQSRKRASILRF